jgi:hypothetical protein
MGFVFIGVNVPYVITGFVVPGYKTWEWAIYVEHKAGRLMSGCYYNWHINLKSSKQSLFKELRPKLRVSPFISQKAQSALRPMLTNDSSKVG